MLWQFFSLPGIENGIEYRYFSRYRIEVRNSSIVTTLLLSVWSAQLWQGKRQARGGSQSQVVEPGKLGA